MKKKMSPHLSRVLATDWTTPRPAHEDGGCLDSAISTFRERCGKTPGKPLPGAGVEVWCCDSSLLLLSDSAKLSQPTMAEEKDIAEAAFQLYKKLQVERTSPLGGRSCYRPTTWHWAVSNIIQFQCRKAGRKWRDSNRPLMVFATDSGIILYSAAWCIVTALYLTVMPRETIQYTSTWVLAKGSIW